MEIQDYLCTYGNTQKIGLTVTHRRLNIIKTLMLIENYCRLDLFVTILDFSLAVSYNWTINKDIFCH